MTSLRAGCGYYPEEHPQFDRLCYAARSVRLKLRAALAGPGPGAGL